MTAHTGNENSNHTPGDSNLLVTYTNGSGMTLCGTTPIRPNYHATDCQAANLGGFVLSRVRLCSHITKKESIELCN